MYIQTVYKTATPKAAPIAEAEYYSISLFPSTREGKTVYLLKETHGWWDEKQEWAQHATTTLAPEEGFATWKEGKEALDSQVRQRITNGFIYGFIPDPEQPRGYRFEKLK